MESRTLVFLFLSGLCLLPVCYPDVYIVVEERKTWADAQMYCRDRYTDLASIHTEGESDQLVAAADKYKEGHLWIGLQNDFDSWRWSLEEEGYYGEGEAKFRDWQHRQPNNINGHQLCVTMARSGRWNDLTCSTKYKFVCYNGRIETPVSSNFVYVNEKKTWEDAQSYCREHYTDLASVRNRAENDELKNIIQDNKTWIGLYRDWKWTDGRPYSFRNWGTAPQWKPNSDCVLLHEGKWQNQMCNKEFYFVCQNAPVKKKKWVLRVKLSKKDSMLNLEDAADAILQQISRTLKEHGMGVHVKLTWRKQPNGKIFNLEKEEKNEKNEEKNTYN